MGRMRWSNAGDFGGSDAMRDGANGAMSGGPAGRRWSARATLAFFLVTSALFWAGAIFTARILIGI